LIQRAVTRLQAFTGGVAAWVSDALRNEGTTTKSDSDRSLRSTVTFSRASSAWARGRISGAGWREKNLSALRHDQFIQARRDELEPNASVKVPLLAGGGNLTFNTWG
jgi:hypothetical protein